MISNGTSVAVSTAQSSIVSFTDVGKVTVQGAPATRMLYSVGGNTDSLNLSALGGSFYDDRLGTTLNGSATLSGTLTHTNTVGMVGAPFRLIGRGGTLNLTNTTLETQAVQIEGPGTFNFLGSRTLASADTGKLLITDGGFRQDQNLTLADANPATLAVLADGSSDTWQRNWLQGNIQLDKRGTGTLSLAAANGIASNATVSAGTLRLTTSDGYPYYRFKVEGVKTPSIANSMQFSEIALFNNGVNVTSNRGGILYDLPEDHHL